MAKNGLRGQKSGAGSKIFRVFLAPRITYLCGFAGRGVKNIPLFLYSYEKKLIIYKYSENFWFLAPTRKGGYFSARFCNSQD